MFELLDTNDMFTGALKDAQKKITNNTERSNILAMQKANPFFTAEEHTLRAMSILNSNPERFSSVEEGKKFAVAAVEAAQQLSLEKYYNVQLPTDSVLVRINDPGSCRLLLENFDPTKPPEDYVMPEELASALEKAGITMEHGKDLFFVQKYNLLGDGTTEFTGFEPCILTKLEDIK